MVEAPAGERAFAAPVWRRVARWLLPCYWVAAACVTHLPPPPEPRPLWPHQDKVWHFGGYLVLGLLLGMAVGGMGNGAGETQSAAGKGHRPAPGTAAAPPPAGPAAALLRRWLASPHWLSLLAILATYAALDELTQPLFARDAELFDWLADRAGAALGLGMASCLMKGARARR